MPNDSLTKAQKRKTYTPKISLRKDRVQHTWTTEVYCHICGVPAKHHVKGPSEIVSPTLHLCTKHFATIFRAERHQQKKKVKVRKKVEPVNELSVRRIELKHDLEDPLIIEKGQKLACVEVGRDGIVFGHKQFLSLYWDMVAQRMFFTTTCLYRYINKPALPRYGVIPLGPANEGWRESLWETMAEYTEEFVSKNGNSRLVFTKACRELMEAVKTISFEKE